jgi:hypothetical protein
MLSTASQESRICWCQDFDHRTNTVPTPTGGYLWFLERDNVEEEEVEGKHDEGTREVRFKVGSEVQGGKRKAGIMQI